MMTRRDIPSLLVDATKKDLPVLFVFDATPETRGGFLTLRARQNTFPGCLVVLVTIPHSSNKKRHL
jgi:hypothetical protein